jgi:hypothetical protein
MKAILEDIQEAVRAGKMGAGIHTEYSMATNGNTGVAGLTFIIM